MTFTVLSDESRTGGGDGTRSGPLKNFYVLESRVKSE